MDVVMWIGLIVILALLMGLYYNVEKVRELEISLDWQEQRNDDLEQRLGEALRELQKGRRL